MFLLMGDNYIGNDEQGRVCHTKRMNFEKNLLGSNNSNFLKDLYSTFSKYGIGREIVLYAKKMN